MRAAILVLCALAAFASAEKLFHGNQVLRTFPSEEQRQYLDSIAEDYDFDFWTEGGEAIDIHVPRIFSPIVQVLLNRNSIEYEVFIDDVQTAINNERDRSRPAQYDLSSFDYNAYHDFDEIDAWIDNVAAAYPDVASVYTVGQSYEGQVFRGLKFSRGSDSNPAFYINCGIHAREWITPASCLYITKYLVEAAQGSEEYSLLQDINIYLTPNSNPDGYKYTWNGDRMWRKTRSDNNKRCLGVDPNRNWDVNWGGQGSSTNPCSDAYGGPSVFSEVEVTSIRDSVLNTPNIQAFIDVHSYSQMMFYPWGYTLLPAADKNLLNTIVVESVAAIKASHGQTYETGQISQIYGVASGSTADYFYKNGVKCSFGAELRDKGRFGFTLPESYIQPTAEETWAGLKVIAKYVQSGQCA